MHAGEKEGAMKDDGASNADLKQELAALRKRIAELEAGKSLRALSELDTRKFYDAGSNFNELRKRAEKTLAERDDDGSGPFDEEVTRLLHEVEVFQVALAIQNEELRLSQIELSEQHERYFNLYDRAPVGYLTLDSQNGTILETNQAADLLFEMEPGAAIGKHIPFLLHKNSRQAFYRRFERTVGGGAEAPIEVENRERSRTIEMESVLVEGVGESGERTVLVAARDVTRMKRYEMELERSNVELERRVERRTAELRSSEERYRALLGVISDYAYALGVEPNGDYAPEWMTGNFEELTGYTLEELKAREAWLKLVHPEDYEIYSQRVKRFLADEETTAEYRLLTKDGAIKWVRDFGKPLERRPNGGALVYCGAQDVTAEKTALDETRKNQDRFRKMIARSGDVFALLSKEGDVEYLSENCKEILGYDADELLGENAFSFVHPDDLDIAREHFADILPEYEKSTALVFRFRVGSGEYRFIEGVARNLVEGPNIGAVLLNARDVTDKAIYERELLESEARISGLINNTDDAVFSFNADLELETMNEAFRLFFISRFERKAERGLALDDFPMEAEEKRRWSGYLDRALAGERFVAEERASAFGSDRVFDYSFNPIRDENDRVIGVAVFSRDITERVESERRLNETVAELQRMHEFHQTLINSTSDHIYAKDREFRYSVVNAAFAKSLGLTPPKVVGKTDAELGMADEILFGDPATGEPGIRAMDEATLRSRERVANANWRLVLPDGSERVYDIVQSPLRNADGEVYGLIGISRDVTGRRQIEEALRASEELNRATIDAIEETIFVVDRDLTILLVNSSFRKMMKSLNVASGAVVGSNVEEALPFLPARVAETMREQFRTGEIAQAEDVWMFGDQRLITATTSVPVLRAGEVERLVSISKDVTDYRVAIERLTKSESELKETIAAKDKFFSIVAHDLRGPFTGLLGFSDYLMRSSDTVEPDRLKDIAEKMNKSAQAVFSLIENLLQWSRVQTGKIQYNPRPVQARKVIDKLFALNQASIVQKKLTTENLVDPTTIVHADESMLQAIVRNLLSNAIKFTPDEGRVTVNARDAGEFVEFVVADTGVGVAPEDSAKLFKIDATHSAKGVKGEDGTGLGLILCKEFVERHGGEIRLESAPGEGAEIRFTIPRSLPPSE